VYRYLKRFAAAGEVAALKVKENEGQGDDSSGRSIDEVEAF